MLIRNKALGNLLQPPDDVGKRRRRRPPLLRIGADGVVE